MSWKIALKEITEQIKVQNITAQAPLNLLKRDIAKKYKLPRIPTNIEILLSLPEEVIFEYKNILLTKPTRTISGVSPLAIMTKPSKCPHGKCTYCPGGINSPWGDVPQSYTGHEPATMRGIRNNYDAYLQVFNRLQQYVLLGQTIDKIEVIVMGGTFTATDKKYQKEFITDCFQAMNDFSEVFIVNDEIDYLKFKEFFELPGEMRDQVREDRIRKKVLALKESSLDTRARHPLRDNLQQPRVPRLRQGTSIHDDNLLAEQERNETAHVRCVALCIETRPDWGFLEHGNEMLKQGCTRVELGIQSVYDDVLKAINRGHTTADSIKSIRILRDLGFKINFHYMPGLPLTDYERDMAGMRELFSNPDYKPDMIKLYPCMVAPGTPLYEQYQRGIFTPITTEEAAKRIAEFYSFVPEFCRIQRVQRDVPTKHWEAGVDRTNLRQFADQKYQVESKDIRAREPKGRKVNWDKIDMKIEEYSASNGQEFFIQAFDIENDILIGFCRMRFPSEFLRSEITEGSALIRELHVYGTATSLGKDGRVQHKGWGQKLMKKAEEIAVDYGKKKMVVISGVGVREYFRKKLGYSKEGPYMIKFL